MKPSKARGFLLRSREFVWYRNFVGGMTTAAVTGAYTIVGAQAMIDTAGDPCCVVRVNYSSTRLIVLYTILGGLAPCYYFRCLPGLDVCVPDGDHRVFGPAPRIRGPRCSGEQKEAVS